MTTATHTLPAGSILAHYRIEEQIGEGAMGTVYRAHDEGLDRKVAVKVLRSGASAITTRIDRFFQEARAAARVNHPNLTHVHYVGADGSYRFFAMEYVQGDSLDDYVTRVGRIDLEEGIDILVQAASGLAAAHDEAIVHRDVKPSNVLIRSDGRVKITDFGLSKSMAGDVAQSHEGLVTGTPSFMSPEQCRGGKIDARADIYALGLTAWSMFVGEPPFPGSNLGEVLNDQMNTPLPPITARRPDLSPSIERVLGKLCAKSPEDRPADMHEVVELLEACRPRALHPAPIVARAVAVSLDLIASLVAMMSISFTVEALKGEGALPENLHFTVYSVLFMLMTVVAETRYQLTIGKWFLNLCVRAADGSEAPRKAYFLRAVLRFPSFAFGAVGLSMLLPGVDLYVDVLGLAAILVGLIAFYATKGKTLSDLLTKTRVVYAMPPDERRGSMLSRGS
jgi:serine/threonine-protein kinase